MQRKFSMIVACSINGVIGRNGDLPWRLSADLKRFKRLTMGHAIIMGRKTYDSLGRLLPGRLSVIVTRQASLTIEGALVVPNLQAALESVPDEDHEPFVIGGGQLYREALPWADKLYLTRVNQSVAGDIYFPVEQIVPPVWQLVDREGPLSCEQSEIEYQFDIYQRAAGDEAVC